MWGLGSKMWSLGLEIPLKLGARLLDYCGGSHGTCGSLPFFCKRSWAERPERDPKPKRDVLAELIQGYG